jgi:low affinity Fe/Cu permease
MRYGSELNSKVEQLSIKATRYAGSTWAFALALAVVLVWAALGPAFGYSTTWQLVINTGTTIITFLMVFLIQRAQNKDIKAVHIKLNELIAALKGASNRVIDVEDLSEMELQVLHKHFQTLSLLAKRDADIGKSRSVEEAEHRHLEKHPRRAS